MSKKTEKDALARWWDEQEGGDLDYGGDVFDDFDYEKSVVSSGRAASDWWKTKVRRYQTSFWSSSSDYKDSYASTESKLRKELVEIARAVNAVRNSKGALKRERNLQIQWSNPGYGRNTIRDSTNNIRSDQAIKISPDPIVDQGIKPSWSESMRRDAVIGEALTLTAMKRTMQPQAVKEVTTDVPVEYWDAGTDLEFVNTPLRIRRLGYHITHELWKSLETFYAQRDLLEDYKGCKAYFAAYLSFYSDPEFKEKIKALAADSDNFNSIKAAAILAWNINHFNSQSEQIDPPQSDGAFIETVMVEAFEELMEGMNERATRDRWAHAVEAAKILMQLDEDLDQKSESEQRLILEEMERLIDETLIGGDGKNGNTNNLFGKTIANDAGVYQSIACDEIQEQEVPGSGYTQIAEKTSLVDYKDSYLKLPQDFSHVDVDEYWETTSGEGSVDEKPNFHSGHKRSIIHSTNSNKTVDSYEKKQAYLRNIRDMNKPVLKMFRKTIEPYAETIRLPVYGLRSGRVTSSSLWRATVNSWDSDRIFNRRIETSVTHKVSVGILMDYSGSMGGIPYYDPRDEDVERIGYEASGTLYPLRAQKQIAVALHDLFSDYNEIDLHLYGHEDKGYANEVGRFESILGVVSRDCGAGTNEGGALARAAITLLHDSQKGSRKILFCIGDGYTNPDEIKKCIGSIRKEGIEVYNILVGSGYSIEDMKAQSTDCYGHGRSLVVKNDEDLMNAINRNLRPWLVKLFSMIHTK